VTGEWRKLHNEELNDLYSAPIIFRVIKSRRMRWAGHVAHRWERRDIHMVWVEKLEGKRTHLRHGRRCEGIKMDLQEVGEDRVDWMKLTQDRDRWRALVKAVMNLRVP
jgi:hypothetical protein